MKNEFPLQVTAPLICCLTFPPLPLLHDGLQPLLFLLWGLGHADEPLVLGRVVDLPAVVHNVPTAVVVSCGGKGVESSGSIWLLLIKTSAHEGWNIFGRSGEFYAWEEGPSVCGRIDHDAVNEDVKTDDSASSRRGKKTELRTGGCPLAHSSSSSVILSAQLDIDYCFSPLMRYSKWGDTGAEEEPSISIIGCLHYTLIALAKPLRRWKSFTRWMSMWGTKGIFVDLRQQGHAWVIFPRCAGTPKSVYAQHPTWLALSVSWGGNDGFDKCK